MKRCIPTCSRVAAATLALALVGTTAAASPTITRYVIAGGGRISSGGVYSIQGTIGQATASLSVAPLVGGPYVLNGGFWAGDALPCLSDYNGDTTVDILDLLDYLADFSACDGQPSPCGTFGNADLNNDGLVDILDFLDFLQAFSAGC
jgi:hypothetical protein